MSSFHSDAWGTWKFSNSSQKQLESFTTLFKCQSSRPKDCMHLRSKSWRFMLDRLKTEKFQIFSGVSTVDVNETERCFQELKEVEPEYKAKPLEVNDSIADLNHESVDDVSRSTSELKESMADEEDEVPKIAGEICDFLKKEPMPGLSAKIEGNEVVKILQAIKHDLSDEESVANLLLSLCPPMEVNMLTQSRWAPALYQHVILPEILGRTSPVPRVLSSAISLLAASSPDACVQLLCLPLLLSSNVLNGPADLMQPAIEVLMKIMEESLPPQQKASLFKAFYKEVLHQSRVEVQEELFPLLQTVAESEGAFSGADPEMLSNLIDWLEMCSQDYASSIKFTKYLVSTLKDTLFWDMDQSRVAVQEELFPLLQTLDDYGINSVADSSFRLLAQDWLSYVSERSFRWF